MYTCACARTCTARKGHRASHRVLSVLRELLPHPQSCCLRLFKKNLTQWWVESERREAVGWGQGAAVPFALLIPQSFPADAWCPRPLSRDAARWGRRWPPLQRGRRGWAEREWGLRRGVDLAEGWAGKPAKYFAVGGKQFGLMCSFVFVAHIFNVRPVYRLPIINTCRNVQQFRTLSSKVHHVHPVCQTQPYRYPRHRPHFWRPPRTWHLCAPGTLP